MKPALHALIPLLHRHDVRLFGATGAGTLLLAVAGYWLLKRWRRVSPEEMERRRRAYLSANGRITDGVIINALTLEGEECNTASPEVLVYSYHHAGVTYDCAQDVSTLPEFVHGYRLDQPVQVRYDLHNPGNSILVSESWSGLWSSPPTSLRA